jgi:hypothetical protein
MRKLAVSPVRILGKLSLMRFLTHWRSGTVVCVSLGAPSSCAV